MISETLGFWTPGPIELVVIFITLGIPVLLVILFIRYLLRSKREHVRLRLELGKLADELEQVRKQAKGSQNDSS